MELRRRGPLQGTVKVPGDKSISHRAILFGAIASSPSRIRGLLDAGDVRRSRAAVEAMGAVVREQAGEVEVVPPARLAEPADVLDCGNSGTTLRLLCGLLAGQEGVQAVLTGDASLRRRPVARVLGPLRKLGAVLSARANDTIPPVVVRGARLVGTRIELPVASAQVKTAVLLAGLFAHGETTVVEPAMTRDHTERMLREMGLRVRVEGTAVTVSPGRPAGISLDVPGDLSSAAFFLAGAACVPGSAVTVRGVGVNPGRSGVLEALGALGAEVRVEGERTSGGEPVADVTVRHRPLSGVELSGALIPRLIDELPVLMVAATQANGRTVIRDAAELRVKESDRLAGMAEWLAAAGAKIALRDDGCEIVGPTPLRATAVRSRLDHRIAMSAAIAQLCAGGAPFQLDDASPVETSFPTFFPLLDGLCGGAR